MKKKLSIVFQAVTQNTASTHILVGLTQSVKIKIHESGKQILCVRKPDFTLKTATRYCLASWNISLKKQNEKPYCYSKNEQKHVATQNVLWYLKDEYVIECILGVLLRFSLKQ